MYLIVVGTVCTFFDGGVLLDVPDLDAHHRVHVEARQLPGLDYSYANLKVLKKFGKRE